RGGGGSPHPPRGHGGDGLPSRLRQARAAVDLSRATARWEGAGGDADARGGFRLAAVRGVDPHAGAVLLLPRPRLQGEGVAAAARAPPRRPPTAGRKTGPRTRRGPHTPHS